VETKLLLHDASFSYGEREIFHNLELDVEHGQVCCILGANGCGKTTLLRCLAGTLQLRSGNIYVDGHDISTLKVPQRARSVGIVFQEHTIPFPYTVLEIVRMGRTAHLKLLATPSKEDTRMAENKLEMVGMLHLKDKPYNQISGGERQLVLIARTMAQEPEVILLDEPTSHLDLRNQVKILSIINQLAFNGLTVIMSTHFPSHTFLVSGKVVVMHDGSFLAVGEANQVVTEANMKAAYGVEVRIASVPLAGIVETVRVCVPVVPKPKDT
jgi:iron complex transport system ATP-binding protein